MIRSTPRGQLDADICQDPIAASRREWLETDGLGGYASGTVGGARTRRYHGLLLVATKPPTERRLMVNGLEEHLVTERERVGISTQHYVPDILAPRGFSHLVEFHLYPWPTWIYTLTLADGSTVTLEKELFVPRGKPVTVITWRLISGRPLTLEVRPLLSGRDIHVLHHQNATLDPTCRPEKGHISWQPYPDLPRIFAHHSGDYQHAPEWYNQFHYAVEKERGLDHVEDLWSPGVLAFSLRPGASHHLVLTTSALDSVSVPGWKRREKVRRGGENLPPRSLEDELAHNATHYLVRRGEGSTICAGYPWFTDWGRDTFLSLRGLCLATGRLDEARHILVEWSKTVDQGMLPNRFPDEGDQPEFNSVDASLWYVVVAGEYLKATKGRDFKILWPALCAIMKGYREGTRFGIRMDADGLIMAGEAGSQLTWMDAKYEDTCYSPRIGKPVEIQALWINALATMKALQPRRKTTTPTARAKAPAKKAVVTEETPDWALLYKTAVSSFQERFWNPDAKCLYDVIDGPGGNDASRRPNQLLAVSLPEILLPAKRAKQVVDACARDLLTPLGLKTLAEGPGYIGTYTDGRRERDAAYHNGTVWPWLFGPFIEAWVKTRPDKAKARKEARKFLEPLDRHLADAGLGHVSEVADGNAPHEPRGCPWQAWSVAEPLRLLKTVLK